MLLYPVGGSNHGCGCVPKHMGQLVAEVSGQTGGSGVKTRWKCEACCYMPAQAPGGTVATWTSVLGAGFAADHARSN